MVRCDWKGIGIGVMVRDTGETDFVVDNAADGCHTGDTGRCCRQRYGERQWAKHQVQAPLIA